MPITLEEAKVGLADKVEQEVIDEFRRGSALLDKLEFADAVSPGTGGSTLTYGYKQLQTPSSAQFREINTEYEPDEAKEEKLTVDLKIFGGSAQVDRVVNKATDNLATQLKQKIKAAKNLFHYATINGGKGDIKEFDGLDKTLKGKSTEYNTGTNNKIVDLSDTENLDKNYKTMLDMLIEFLSGIDGKPDFLVGNGLAIAKLKSVAYRAGYLTKSEDSFGRNVQGYDDIPFLDLGYFYDKKTKKSLPCVPIDATAKTTDIYAVTLGMDAFHGVSLAGEKIINTYLPDLAAPGAVKKCEVEMVSAVVLKNTLKAGVFRGVKVQ